MKRLIVQAMLAFILVVGVLAVTLPTHVAHATSAKPSKPLNGPIDGESDKGPSAVDCLGTTWYAFKGNNGDNHINIDQFGPQLPTVASFTDTTPETPAIACFNNRIYAAWTANDSSHAIHVGWWNGNGTCNPCVFQGGRTIPGQSTTYAPALAANGGQLYAAWRGLPGNSHLYIEQSIDGWNWVAQLQLNDTAVEAPALTSYLGHLWLAWPGTDPGNRIWFGWYNNNSTLNNHGNIPIQTDYLQVGLSVYNQRLQFAWKGFTNSNVYTESYQPPSSFVFNGVLPNTTTYWAPALDGKLCFYTGTDKYGTLAEQDVYPYL